MSRFLAMLVAPALLPGCLSPATATPQASGHFVCANGTEFRVAYFAGEAVITTSTGVFRLARRSSSIGRRYVSATATFIEDEDRAALNGISGLSFRKCHRAGSEPEPGGGTG